MKSRDEDTEEDITVDGQDDLGLGHPWKTLGLFKINLGKYYWNKFRNL